MISGEEQLASDAAMSKDNRDEPRPSHSSSEMAGRHISQIETLWPMLRQAHGGTADQVNAAQEVILKRYRPAVYRYLLACVGDADAADELCQEFALRFLRGDFRNANPERGRFRDLLKSALYHLVIDHHKKKKKNLPGLSQGPEPAASEASTMESDRRFIEAWRAELLRRAWEALAEEEKRTGRYLHTVLHFRAEHPDLRSAQMAEHLSARLHRELSADWVRKWLHEAREVFARMLLNLVAESLEDTSFESLEQELIDLKLHEYCKTALDKRRKETE